MIQIYKSRSLPRINTLESVELTGTLDAIELAALIIATYGAILSTILAIYKFLEDRKRLKVEVSPSLVASGSGVQKALDLICSNLGKRPITIISYGITLPNKRNIFFFNRSPQALPCTLSDGQCCILSTSWGEIAETVADEGYKDSVELAGYFVDATGRRYYGKKIRFIIEE
jgi:hypothetical protein